MFAIVWILMSLILTLGIMSDAQTIDVGTLKEIPDILPFKFYTFNNCLNCGCFFGIKFEILSLPREKLFQLCPGLETDLKDPSSKF